MSLKIFAPGAALALAIAAGIAMDAQAGDRLILDPAPAAVVSTSGDLGGPKGSGASVDDLDQRVRDLEAQKADVDHKAKSGVSLDISGSASAQVSSVKR